MSHYAAWTSDRAAWARIPYVKFSTNPLLIERVDPLLTRFQAESCGSFGAVLRVDQQFQLALEEMRCSSYGMAAMKIPVLLCLVFCLLGCRSSRSSSPSFASFDAHSDIPISQQYAEIIAPDTYRVYNVFALPDGEIRRLGHFDISIGQIIRIPGTPEFSIHQIEVAALEVKDDELHLRSTYLPDQGPSLSQTSSIPIRE